MHKEQNDLNKVYIKKLITSGAMLIAIASLCFSAVFGWFVSNKKVSSDGFSVSVQDPGDIKSCTITVYPVSEINEQTGTYTFVEPTEGQAVNLPNYDIYNIGSDLDYKRALVVKVSFTLCRSGKYKVEILRSDTDFIASDTSVAENPIKDNVLSNCIEIIVAGTPTNFPFVEGGDTTVVANATPLTFLEDNYEYNSEQPVAPDKKDALSLDVMPTTDLVENVEYNIWCVVQYYDDVVKYICKQIEGGDLSLEGEDAARVNFEKDISFRIARS